MESHCLLECFHSSAVYEDVIEVTSKESLECDFNKWLAKWVFSFLLDVLRAPPSSQPVSSDSSQSSSPSSPLIWQQKKYNRRREKKDGEATLLLYLWGPKTNIYGRIYVPGQPLTVDDRPSILGYHYKGFNVKDIAKRLGISHGCVSKTIQRWVGSSRKNSGLVANNLPLKPLSEFAATSRGRIE